MLNFLSLLVLSSCSLVKLKIPKSNSAPIKPFGEIIMDVSEGRYFFSEGNPIAALRLKIDEVQKNMSVCTAFLIAPRKVLTNFHCVYNVSEKRLASPEEITLFLKSPTDTEQTKSDVVAILDYNFKTDEKTNSPIMDWALLETKMDLSYFRPLSLSQSFPNLDELRSDLKITISRLNFTRLTSSTQDCLATLAPVEGSLYTSPYFTAETLSSLTQKSQELCKNELDRNSSNYENKISECNKLVFTEKHMHKLLEQKEQFIIKDTKIRKGNSGSPVIYNGQVIGIIHSALFKKDDPEPNQDTTVGIMQLFYKIVNDLYNM